MFDRWTRRLRNVNMLRSSYYSYFSRHVRCAGKAKFLIYRGSAIGMDAGAQVKLSGTFAFGCEAVKGADCAAYLRMDKDACIEVQDGFRIYYRGDVIVFSGGRLTLGSGFINSNAKIRCHSSITIGHGVAISHDFTVMDSDAHVGLWNGGQKTAPVHIGNHVWIGTRVTVLKGVSIGDGAIIGAGSVVTHDIPPRCLAAGVPARVLREDVDWR